VTLVIDASVASKWVLPEEGVDRAARLREDERDFIAPTLIAAEIGNAVWKRVVWHEMGNDDADRAIRLGVALVTRLVPMEDLARRALEIAIELKHPIYDCFYLALAERERAPLITADKRLLALRRKMKGAEIRAL
jgi:predicted nucleic acid-binding protein